MQSQFDSAIELYNEHIGASESQIEVFKDAIDKVVFLFQDGLSDEQTVIDSAGNKI